ncbi:uncharacterized protein EKO05_0001692 [Ascochyta rabiei]|uniref:uncharacterized protein n=1 Tax=Didymella rabiei TaxID=5454 RepID=UPI00220EF9AB|nr:uncharacterized protein EKO05_0001692 [Ascochyta rabiei]UPX11068.1 hypothetical protein EKO05_0001692 [Ascochyta rabiei]
MKLLIEYQQPYWRVELITSSSREVFGSTTLAEIPRLDTKAESTSSVDLSTGTFVQRPRRSRRKALRKRFDTLISHLTCASRRSVREAEERKTSHIDSTLAGQEIVHRRVTEMAGSDVEIYQAAEPEWFKNDFEPPCELDSTYIWRNAQPLARQGPSSAVLVGNCAQTPPDLSPQSVSQKSSPILPNTPTAAGSDPSLCQQNGGSLVGTISPYDVATLSQHRHEFPESLGYGIPESPVFFDVGDSMVVQGSHDLDLLNPNVEWSESIFQQFDRTNHTSYSQMNPTTLHTDSQQAILVAPSSSTPEDKSARKIKALLGTWELAGDSTWTRLDEHGSMPDAEVGIVYTSHLSYVESSPDQDGTYARNRHTDESLNVSQADASSANQKEWPPVQCEHCKAVYTGQYGAGNMKRHVNNTCKEAPYLQKTHDCGICKNSYNRSDALRNHERRIHPNSTITQPRKKSARMLGLVDEQQASRTS